MKGLSIRNVQYMRLFAEKYGDYLFTQQSVAQIPWGHHVVIMDKVKTADDALFYVSKTLENGWSRDILSLQIKSNLHQGQGVIIFQQQHQRISLISSNRPSKTHTFLTF